MSECEICEVGLLQQIYRVIRGRGANMTLCEECAEQMIQEMWEEQIPVAVVEERDDDSGV
jgi:ribosome-binding protein aMBF1 (putative translation factor)